MEAKQKKQLMMLGAFALVAFVLMRMKRNKSTEDTSSVVDGLNLPGLGYGNGQYTVPDGNFSYAGGGSNMFVDGANIAWPAMQIYQPILVEGSNYGVGDMLSINPYEANISATGAPGGPQMCCCDDASDPVTTVSSGWLIAQIPPQQNQPYQGYHNMNPAGGNMRTRWSIGA